MRQPLDEFPAPVAVAALARGGEARADRAGEFALTRAEQSARRERTADIIARSYLAGATLAECGRALGFSQQYASKVLAEFYDMGLLSWMARRVRGNLVALDQSSMRRPGRGGRPRKDTVQPPMGAVWRCREAGMAWADICLAFGLPVEARDRLCVRVLRWAARCGLREVVPRGPRPRVVPAIPRRLWRTSLPRSPDRD